MTGGGGVRLGGHAASPVCSSSPSCNRQRGQNQNRDPGRGNLSVRYWPSQRLCLPHFIWPKAPGRTASSQTRLNKRLTLQQLAGLLCVPPFQQLQMDWEPSLVAVQNILYFQPLSLSLPPVGKGQSVPSVWYSISLYSGLGRRLHSSGKYQTVRDVVAESPWHPRVKLPYTGHTSNYRMFLT